MKKEGTFFEGANEVDDKELISGDDRWKKKKKKEGEKH